MIYPGYASCIPRVFFACSGRKDGRRRCKAASLYLFCEGFEFGISYIHDLDDVIQGVVSDLAGVFVIAKRTIDLRIHGQFFFIYLESDEFVVVVQFVDQFQDLGEVGFIELDDIYNELQSATDGLTYSPERQQQVDERLALLYRLEKKHGVSTVAELIALREELDRKLQSIATLDDRIQQLMEQVDKAYTALQAAADALTASRVKAGKVLSKNILPTLHELGMPEARFCVECTPSASYGASGHDSVSFLFNANRGGELRDLAKVASGGEMSRVMLAVKSMLTSRRLLPTILFDEVDTGVSGDISVAVGKIMCRMAEKMQVVAITHLPQIAARAHQHLKVYKESDADRTVSHIRELALADRVTEVAVMLSSDPPTPAALQTAKELMS